mmetsp:Transcript_98655/g.255051  ORF Transcript_98655/g.255051 Transcript_98655/m.255051 type:complete len:593 (+) Transcript_98655:382-2160(+)
MAGGALVLRGGGLRLQAREIREDHLEEAEDPALGVLHARVRVPGGGLRGLQQARALGGLLVEAAQHAHGLLHGHLRSLGVLHGLGVRGLGLHAELLRLRLAALELGDGVGELGDLARKACSRRGELVHLGGERLRLGRLVLPGHLVRRQLGGAVGVVVRLLVRLLHEPHDEVLDHLLHLAEGVLLHTRGHHRQVAAVELGSLPLQVGHRLLAHSWLRAHGAAELRQRGRLLAGLEERGEVRLAAALHVLARDDGDGLLDGLHLRRARHLVALVLLGGSLALCGRVVEDLLVLALGLLGDRQVALRLGLVAQAAGPRGGLLARAVFVGADVVRELLQQHLVVVLGVELRLLEGQALLLEARGELLQQVDDAAGLELVGVGLGHAGVAAALHREEGHDHGLGLCRNDLGGLHLHQRLRHIRRPSLQHRNGALARLDGLRVVQVLRLIVGLLLLALSLGSIGLSLVGIDGGLQVLDLAGEHLGVGGRLVDVRAELHDLVLCLANRLGLREARVVAPLLELGELDLFRMLLRLALREHAIEKLNYLRDWRHPSSRRTLLGAIRTKHYGQQRCDEIEGPPDHHAVVGPSFRRGGFEA